MIRIKYLQKAIQYPQRLTKDTCIPGLEYRGGLSGA